MPPELSSCCNDFLNLADDGHGNKYRECDKCRKPDVYSLGNAVRDLTHLGGIVLTKSKAKEILERLLANYEVKQ